MMNLCIIFVLFNELMFFANSATKDYNFFPNLPSVSTFYIHCIHVTKIHLLFYVKKFFGNDVTMFSIKLKLV